MGQVGSLGLLGVALALTACVPYTPDERGIEVNPAIERLTYQSKAMFTTQFMVEDHYDVELGDLWLDATVYWADTFCPLNNHHDVIYEGRCYKGLTWNCGEIYVAISDVDQYKVTGTALLHEFGHCLLMTMNGSVWLGDADHKDLEFWSVINDAELVTKTRGW